MTEPLTSLHEARGALFGDLEAVVGKNLRIARESVGRTQAQVGAIIGLDRSAISDIERGKRKLTAGELALVCEYLQVDPVSLFRESGYEDQLRSLAAQGVADSMAACLPTPSS